MMTKREFITRRAPGKRHQIRFGIVFGVCYVIVGAVVTLCSYLFADHFHIGNAKDQNHDMDLFRVLFMIYFFGGICLAGWIGKRKARELGVLLVCPSCKNRSLRLLWREGF